MKRGEFIELLLDTVVISRLNAIIDPGTRNPIPSINQSLDRYSEYTECAFDTKCLTS